MDVVAILALGGPVETEAPALAAELGVTAYEAGLLLRGKSPIVVLRTEDRQRALTLLGNLRARGHDTVACDGSAVVASAAMTTPRSFRLDPDALVSLGSVEERLRFADLVAIVRAMHESRAESIEKTHERKLSAGRAMLTGGLVPTKTVTREHARTTTEREPVLYLFRSGGAPWLIAATRARYDGLSTAPRPSQLENFGLLVERLRQLAPHAPYDDRLVSSRAATASAGETSARAIDLLAHIVAMAIARRRT